jgi:hypothetical protein
MTLCQLSGCQNVERSGLATITCNDFQGACCGSQVESVKAMEPVLIPACDPSCPRHGAEEEPAQTVRANQTRSSSPSSRLKKRRCVASSEFGPCMSAPFVRPPTFIRTVSEADITSPECVGKEIVSRKRRRVQFDASDKVHKFLQFASTHGDTGNKEDMWYSRSELSEMRDSARCQTLLRRNDSLDLSLNKVYMNAKNQLTPHDVVDSALELIGHPLFGELRGLERWGSDNFRLSRGTAILHAKSEVLLSQCATSASILGSRHGEAMAKQCETVNEPAQKFAQVIGLVDYILAQM